MKTRAPSVASPSKYPVNGRTSPRSINKIRPFKLSNSLSTVQLLDMATGITPLHLAAGSGDVNKVRLLIK